MADSHPALFAYPKHAAFGRVIPKKRIFDAAKPKRRVKDQLTDKVAQLVWQYKLAPESINIASTKTVPEIQIFTVALKQPGMNEDLPRDVLHCIDQAIPSRIIFELTAAREDHSSPDRIKVAAAYKRASEADHSKWVIGEYFSTEWIPADAQRTPLPVVTDLSRLYEEMLRRLIPISARQGETLEELTERYQRIAAKERECQKMEAKLHREKQFNRKVEINRELRELKAELNQLSNV